MKHISLDDIYDLKDLDDDLTEWIETKREMADPMKMCILLTSKAAVIAYTHANSKAEAEEILTSSIGFVRVLLEHRKEDI